MQDKNETEAGSRKPEEQIPPATLDDALAIMRDLRARDAWDRAQTHDSLRPYLGEEMHELDDAILSGDDAAMRSELGDVLLQVLFHAIIAEERGAFDIASVAGSLVAKMTKRHPWLYETADGGRQTAEREPWEKMKSKTRRSLAEGLPQGLPSLHRGLRLQERAAGVGFDWPDVNGPIGKVREELAEVEAEIALNGATFETHGLLFSVVNLCRKAGVHPSLALDKANAKFQARFEGVEALAAARGIDVKTAGLTVLDSLWDEVKATS
jgi:ATP diphosphatase